MESNSTNHQTELMLKTMKMLYYKKYDTIKRSLSVQETMK